MTSYDLFEEIEYRGYNILLTVEETNNSYYYVTVRTPMNTPPEMADFYESQRVNTISDAKSKLYDLFPRATTKIDQKVSNEKELQEVYESLDETATELEEQKAKLEQYLSRMDCQKNL